ncbi:MAG: ABC transporter permease [Candidatus Korobacteraceae bacterium]|jgi:ABC-2 type transport system permease protein
MSFTRFLAVAKKEVVQILRDSRSLIIVLIMPLILVLLFGYGVNLDLKGLPVYVYDRDGSRQSQDLLKRFQASAYFNLVRVVNDYPALARSLDDGHAKMGIVIPWDFTQRLNDGRPAQVQVLVDGSDDNTANVLIGYAQAVVQGYSSEIQLNWLRNRGQLIQPAPVSVETRTWYNEDLESSAFIVPGVLALVMSVIGAFLTSLTIAREWERGTMEQLISTPVTPLEIMLGKLAPYFIIGMFDVVVCALVAIYWFHVPFRGSFLTLLVSSAMFMVVVLSLGFFISVIAKSQLAASQIALLVTFLPAFLLSGFLYAIEQMPAVLQWITRILPARYYVSVLKKIFLKGTPAALLYADLVPLAGFTFVLALLAIRAFRKKLA